MDIEILFTSTMCIKVFSSGRVSDGETIFEIIKNAEIKFSLPQKVAQTNVLIKRLKKKKEKSGLETTFGVRGYVHYPEKFDIYIDIQKDKIQKIENVLKRIRRFGTSDSLVWCKELSKQNPPKNAIFAANKIGHENNRNILVLPVKDINPNIEFKDINIYDKKKRKDILERKVFSIHISRQSQGKNWMVYEFS